MFYRIIRNDLLKSKAISSITLAFIACAALLVALAAILIANLSGAIDHLMAGARTPHFLQMHSGDIDEVRLQAFAAQNGNVDEYQVLAFLNVDGAQIAFPEKTLASSVQDNGLMVQSEKFDFLLDLDGKVIETSAGEIYVPLCYLQDGSASVGDVMSVHGKEFMVAGFLRDSQMNSPLASSKRFLVSPDDFDDLSALGNTEYLIEFRLKDLSEIGDFEADYISAGLEANGPTITYALFKTINAISDGLMIAVIILVSILVVIIAFLCIRFTLLAKIEDDYREIGVMKAIGLRISEIKKLYLAKYMTLAALGCLLGFALSFVFRDMLLENIRLYMGESADTSLAAVLGVSGVLLVFLAVTVYVDVLLNCFRKISAVQAIRFGVTQGNAAGAGMFSLSRVKWLGTNIFLGMKDVLARKSLFLTMLAVLILSAFIINVPQNLYNTISSNDFISYMGIGQCDVRIDIQQTAGIPEKAAQIAARMEDDSSIKKYVVLTTRTFTIQTDDGTEERIKIELGDHSVFPIKYSDGRAPVAENEIALSAMNAAELGKVVGEHITLLNDGQEMRLTVCGIYSDITNGGKTAKAVFTSHSAQTMWSVINAQLAEPALTHQVIAEYEQMYGFAKISDIHEFILQTFGSTIRSIGVAAYAAIAAAILITALVTLLFMKMLIARDRYSIAIMKALGFTGADIRMQYLARSLFVLLLGVSLGAWLANTLGEALAAAVIASFGASSFEFVVDPLSAYLLTPLMMACAVLAATLLGTAKLERINISENIKE